MEVAGLALALPLWAAAAAAAAAPSCDVFCLFGSAVDAASVTAAAFGVLLSE